MTEVDNSVTNILKTKNRLRAPKKIILTKSHPEYRLSAGLVLKADEVAKNGEYVYRFLFEDGSEGYIPTQDAIKYQNKDDAIVDKLSKMLEQLQDMTTEIINLKSIVERNSE